MERSGHGLVEVHCRIDLEGPRKAMTNSSQDSCCPCRNSNQVLPEYKSTPIYLDQPAFKTVRKRGKCVTCLVTVKR
jgi:hypothetical protein